MSYYFKTQTQQLGRTMRVGGAGRQAGGRGGGAGEGAGSGQGGKSHSLRRRIRFGILVTSL